jgi:hypothetical protein
MDKTLSEVVERAKTDAVRKALFTRLEIWLDNANVASVTEVPEMKAKDCGTLSPLMPTGKMVITIELDNVQNLGARVKKGGDARKPEDWEAMQT